MVCTCVCWRWGCRGGRKLNHSLWGNTHIKQVTPTCSSALTLKLNGACLQSSKRDLLWHRTCQPRPPVTPMPWSCSAGLGSVLSPPPLCRFTHLILCYICPLHRHLVKFHRWNSIYRLRVKWRYMSTWEEQVCFWWYFVLFSFFFFHSGPDTQCSAFYEGSEAKRYRCHI